MRLSCVLLIGIVFSLLSAAIASYDGGYAQTHDLDDYYEPSYPAPPIVHSPHGHHGHGHSPSAGSYYHYHVPLVGQQQHYQPSYHHQDHSHYLWPLLLLLALPLLFLPLLPLLLLPIGISLLALLAPGAMMMMMMMMMMGGEMMMRRDSAGLSGRAFNEMRTFGEVILLDMTSLMSKYARSLDLDQCPQLMACEMGAIIFPDNNSTDASTAKAFSSFIMEQYLPKGKIKKTVKQFEKAFWTGSTSSSSCKAFNCQPTFKIYKSFQDQVYSTSKNGSATNNNTTSQQTKTSSSSTSSKWTAHKNVNYIYSHPKNKDNGQNHSKISLLDDVQSVTTESPVKLKMKRSHYSQRYGDLGKQTGGGVGKPTTYLGGNQNKAYFSSVFGTPVVKS